ncbi:MAG: 3,4-dihydroxy-2-butanone-4-phosphate synthase [Mailhella sp.]|nr:3,4-dihydroxy-2-butanone-4-phosphate synthase [Mailhella sp.]
MRQLSLLDDFGTPKERVERCIESLKNGNGVLIVDDEDRENEGDLIYAAETITPAQMALLIRECSGIVCLCLTDEKAAELDLPPMVQNNTNKNRTAFTVSIEAAEGVTTGVSASDRVTTIKAAVAPDAKPSDLNRPGHIFPLRARPNGVLERRGHTEVTVDLCRLAGFAPAGVLCELTMEDGTMARLPEVAAFAKAHGMPLATVEDVAQYRLDMLKA